MIWHVESTEFPIVLDQDSKVIVELPKTTEGRRLAKFIAAAPATAQQRDELLKAAREVAGYLDQQLEAGAHFMNLGTGVDRRHIVEGLRSAIAKAEMTRDDWGSIPELTGVVHTSNHIFDPECPLCKQMQSGYVGEEYSRTQRDYADELGLEE